LTLVARSLNAVNNKNAARRAAGGGLGGRLHFHQLCEWEHALRAKHGGYGHPQGAGTHALLTEKPCFSVAVGGLPPWKYIILSRLFIDLV